MQVIPFLQGFKGSADAVENLVGFGVLLKFGKLPSAQVIRLHIPGCFLEDQVQIRICFGKFFLLYIQCCAGQPGAPILRVALQRFVELGQGAFLIALSLQNETLRLDCR